MENEKKPVDCVATRSAIAAGVPADMVWEEPQKVGMKLSDMAGPKDQWTQMVDLFYSRTEKHIVLVQKYAQIIYERFDHVPAELVTRAFKHDASKYQPPEYTPYVYLTWGKKCGMDFTDICRRMPECKIHGFRTPQNILDAIDKATFHHITNNEHHPEFFAPNLTDDKTKIVIATAMDVISLAEMCADWAAMSEELGTGLVQWAYGKIDIKWRFHPDQKRHIADFLTACVENG
jgi:hypothetical protein